MPGRRSQFLALSSCVSTPTLRKFLFFSSSLSLHSKRDIGRHREWIQICFWSGKSAIRPCRVLKFETWFVSFLPLSSTFPHFSPFTILNISQLATLLSSIMPSQVSNSSAPASAQIPPAPNSAQSPVQNNEDESDDEYGGYMRSSSPALPEASSDGPDGFPSFPSSDGDELNASAARSRTAPPNNVGPLRNETAAVRHLSERLKLHPYQHAASEELLKVSCYVSPSFIHQHQILI